MECVKCVCVWLGVGVGGEGGEWMREFGWSLPILWGQWKCWTCFLCFGCGGVGGVGWEWVGGLDQGREW